LYNALLVLVPLFVVWDMQSSVASGWLAMPRYLGLPIFFMGYALLVLLMRRWGRRLAEGWITGHPGKAVSRFNLGLIAARVIIPVWFAVAVFLLGWNDAVLGPIGRWPVATPAVFLGLLPGLLAWMGLWWGQFPVDRALREHNVLNQLQRDLPVFAPVNFGKYFIHKLRTQMLFVLVPWLVLHLLRELAMLGMHNLSANLSGNARAPHWLSTSLMNDRGDAIISLVCVLIVMVISPELLRRVLHTERLPDLPLRQDLSDMCQRSGVGCRDILVWRTHHNMGNAAMMGVVPWVRYIMMSDLLLESMTNEQIQAVFAHELGHVKHRHVMWFAAFLLTFSGALMGVFNAVESNLKLTQNQELVYQVCTGSFWLLATWLAFGFLSRWFERQADVYAARTLQLANLSEDPDQSGASIFASALHRVAMVNNIPVNAPNWSHGSIASRMRYIRRFGRDPLVAQRFDRTGRLVMVGLVILILLCTVIAIAGGLR
jgi:STE24 endopeptidase